MMTREGNVKLTDFGLAIPAVAPDDQGRASVQAVMGTPVYMAPEQLRGAAVDQRTDVYALACLAYDLLAGRRLFTAKSMAELLQQKQGVSLPPASDIGQGIGADLYEFLQSALRTNPDERPPSVTPLLPWAARCDPPPQELVDEISA